MTSNADFNARKSKTKHVEEDEDEAIDEDPSFYRGSGELFSFPNGDQYVGDYIAHVSGLVWREGKGTYTTQDGQVYSGIWYNDHLKDDSEVEITYPNGYKYSGNLEKNQYNGPAMYTIQEGLHILSRFVDNKPVGEICLLDEKGREWRATAGDGDALLLPEHVYFNDISPRLGKGTLRIQRARRSTEQSTTRSVTNKRGTMDQNALNKLELKIFSKTKKTISDLKFEHSDWYRNWTSFRKAYDRIHYKLRTIGEDGLCQDERDWLSKYDLFKKRYLEIMESRTQPKLTDLENCKFFELFNSEDYMPPILVFTSTYGEDSKEHIEPATNESFLSRSFAWQI